jgi:hypothetical protein
MPRYTKLEREFYKLEKRARDTKLAADYAWLPQGSQPNRNWHIYSHMYTFHVDDNISEQNKINFDQLDKEDRPVVCASCSHYYDVPKPRNYVTAQNKCRRCYLQKEVPRVSRYTVPKKTPVPLATSMGWPASDTDKFKDRWSHTKRRRLSFEAPSPWLSETGLPWPQYQDGGLPNTSYLSSLEDD